MIQKTNQITTVSSVLNTIASEEIITASELDTQDRPLEEVLNEKKETDEQGERK